jgi:hypothetical protein
MSDIVMDGSAVVQPIPAEERPVDASCCRTCMSFRTAKTTES